MGQAKRRVGDQNMAAALFAEMPVAHLGLLVAADKLRTLRDLHVVLFPQNVRAHRRAGMRSARVAMAVAHLERHAGNLDCHHSAKTGPGMRFVHCVPACLVRHFASEATAVKCQPPGTFRRAVMVTFMSPDWRPAPAANARQAPCSRLST